MSVKVKLDTAKLDALIATVPQKADEIAETAAHQIEAQAKVNIQRWPIVDTGAMMNSIMVEKEKKGIYQIGDFGDYHERRSVGGMTHYAVYWELGHRNLFLRRYVRKPFLLPAVEYVTAKLKQMIERGLFQ